MINCAHPEHFKHVLNKDNSWLKRIGGIRANALTLSHAELDESVTLDAGNKGILAEHYYDLYKILPNLKVIGGCWGRITLTWRPCAREFSLWIVRRILNRGKNDYIHVC